MLCALLLQASTAPQGYILRCLNQGLTCKRGLEMLLGRQQCIRTCSCQAGDIWFLLDSQNAT
jgi:hypothetical protein